jgi:hypothetical protein
MGASAIGGMLGQKAANKGPRSMFPGQLQQFLDMFSGGSGPGSGGVSGTPFGVSSFNTMNQMAQTGMPTDVGPAWNSMVTANKQMTQQGLNNLMTQFGGSGARYSSGAMMAGNNYMAQSNNNFMSILANYTMQAQEAARARQMQASQTGFGAFRDIATMFTQPKGSVAGAGLSSVGSSLQLISLLQGLNGMGSKSSSASTGSWG